MTVVEVGAGNEGDRDLLVHLLRRDDVATVPDGGLRFARAARDVSGGASA